MASSPGIENISLFTQAKSTAHLLLSRPEKRGVGHRHERWDGLRWTRQCCARGDRRAAKAVSDRSAPDERRCCVRQNRVVPAPVAGVELCGGEVPDRVQPSLLIRGATEARGIRLRGDHGLSRKAIAQGMSDRLRCTCMLVCAPFCAHCTRDRGCSVHPAFPAPSLFEWCENDFETSGASRRENAV